MIIVQLAGNYSCAKGPTINVHLKVEMGINLSNPRFSANTGMPGG